MLFLVINIILDSKIGYSSKHIIAFVNSNSTEKFVKVSSTIIWIRIELTFTINVLFYIFKRR